MTDDKQLSRAKAIEIAARHGLTPPDASAIWNMCDTDIDAELMAERFARPQTETNAEAFARFAKDQLENDVSRRGLIEDFASYGKAPQ